MTRPTAVPVPPTDGQPAAAAATAPHSWIPQHTTFAITTMLQLATEEGQRSGTGFKPQAWKKTERALNTTFNISITGQQLKNKMNAEKGKLSSMVRMANLSGWGFDDVLGKPTAPEDVMNGYINSLKGAEKGIARSIVTNGLANHKILSELFERNLATGFMAAGSRASSQASSQASLQLYSQSALQLRDLLDFDTNNFGDDDPPTDAAGNILGTSSSSAPTPVSLPVEPVRTPTQQGGTKRSSATNGERDHRSHKKTPTGQDQIAALAQSIQQVSALLNAPDTPSPLPPSAPVNNFAGVPADHQMAVRTMQNLGALLTRLNGQFNGEECSWLKPSNMFQYSNIFRRSPYFAACFLGCDDDATAVGFLKDLFETRFDVD
ncbi:hypothetical protein HDU98_012325 [Podochytrium sp. JEL0797]|nr:hypothetical protein HDU98_012325 [Podochytrium sp. JEL0797]